MMIFEVKDYASLRLALQALCGDLDGRSVRPERVFDSKLVASELLGNVLRHTDGIAKLRWEVQGDFVELHILSSVAFVPPKTSQPVGVFSEHGRGLYLVDSLCVERTMTEEGGICVRIQLS